MRSLLGALAVILCSCHPKERAAADLPAPPKEVRPALALSLEVHGLAWIRDVVKFDVRIKNISDREVDVVKSLDGSDVAMRFPLFTARLWGPDGKKVYLGGGRCGNCNGLRKADVAALKPNEEFDPLGEGSFGPDVMTRWKPALLGKHRLTLTVDYTAAGSAQWNGPIERSVIDGEKVRQLLARVPRERMETTIEFEVTD